MSAPPAEKNLEENVTPGSYGSPSLRAITLHSALFAVTRLVRISVVSLLALFGSGTAARAAGWAPPPVGSMGAAPAPAAPPPQTAVAPPSSETSREPPPPGESPSPIAAPAPGVGAPQLLRGADAAVARGDLTSARILFQRLVSTAPTAPEAVEARRALAVMSLSAQTRPAAAAPERTTSVATGDPRSGTSEAIVLREEPYSTKTSERLRLTAWEKLDFGVTAFLYGMSLGFSYSLGIPTSSSAAEHVMPIALGATAYTLGAVGYLSVAKPDRGDLPLMLAITSYVPTTTLLLGHLAEENPSDKKMATATVAAGLVSIPLAVAITQKVNLDPGDTQLVRDAGFWGLVLSTAGTIGFGSETVNSFDYSYRQPPSGRKVAGLGLLGLFGGLGLGAATAAGTEISLERVRVTTWGGYGGGIIGALIGASLYGHQEDEGAFRGFTIGALTGLVVTFATTASLDGIPPDARTTATAARTTPRLTPSLTSMRGADGVTIPALGLGGVL